MNKEFPYICHLDAKSLERARKELNEVEKEREGAIQTLRDWVTQQSWLQSPIDSAFLLRFLRVRKFSQLGARQTIENYWTGRTKTSEWFANASPDDSDILDIISTGFYVPLPEADSEGRRIMLERPGALNVPEIKKKYHGLETFFKAATCLQDWFCMDERMQVNGYVLLIDTTGMGLDSSEVYSISNTRKVMPLMLKAYPIRIKGINIYNMSAVFEALIKFAQATFMPEKIANRIHVHGKSLVSVYDVIDKRLLPREYLPDDYDGPCAGTIAEIIEHTKAELCRPEVVAYIKDLNSGKYRVDFEKRKKEDVPVESFRKLNVD